MPIVTYQDAKNHLNLTDDNDAYEVAQFIDAATAIVEQRIGVVGSTSFTDTFDAYGWWSIPLRHTPVLSVQSVTEYVINTPQTLTSEPVGSTLDAYGFRLESPNSGILTRRSFGTSIYWRGVVTVTYTAGRSSVPAPVRLATLIILAHLWQTQRGAVPLPSLGGDEAGPSDQAAGLPALALDLLQGYDIRTPVIA